MTELSAPVNVGRDKAVRSGRWVGKVQRLYGMLLAKHRRSLSQHLLGRGAIRTSGIQRNA